MDKFLTIKEIARILKVNEVTVRRWIKRKWLPAIKIGKMFRVKEKDFKKLGNKAL